MADEVYISSEAIGITSIPVVLANNSIAIGVTSIPTSLGISTQALTVADRIVSGMLVGELIAAEITQKQIKYSSKGRVRIKYVIRNKQHDNNI